MIRLSIPQGGQNFFLGALIVWVRQGAEGARDRAS